MKTFYDLYQDLINAGMKVNFVPSDTISINETMKCTGSFDGEELRLAIFHQDALQVFLHEYCHFLQHQEEQWVSEEEITAFNAYDSWLNGEIELSDTEAKMCMKVIQACELDCEQRTIKLIKEMNLDYSIELYARRANAYVYFYDLTLKYRKWSTRGNPAHFPEVYNLCSNQLPDSIVDIDKCIYKNQHSSFEQAVIKHCL